MASVGAGLFETTTVSGLGNRANRLEFRWTLGSQSALNNTSTINWTMKGRGGDGTSVTLHAFTVTVNGLERINHQTAINITDGWQFTYGTAVIPHDAGGGKIFGASSTGRIHYNSQNSSGSQAWELPAIPRNATFSGTEAGGSWGDSDSLSYSIHNPVNGYVKLIVYKDTNTNSLWFTRNLGKPSTSVLDSTLSSSEASLIQSYYSNTATFAHRVEIRTYANSNYTSQIGGSAFFNINYNIEDANPTFVGFTYHDSNSTTTNITGNNQYLIGGKSSLSLYIPSSWRGQARKSATMSTYKVLANGNTIYSAYSTSNKTINVGTITAQTDTLATIQARDSRGLITGRYNTVKVLAYTSPKLNATITRNNSFESLSTLKVSGTISRLNISGSDKNTLTTSAVQFRSLVSGGSWSSWITLSRTYGAGSFTCPDYAISLDNTKTAQIQVRVTDKLETTYKYLTLQVGNPLFYLDKKRNSVGVGLITDKTNSFEIEETKDMYYKGKLIRASNHLGKSAPSTSYTNTTGTNTEWTNSRVTVVIPESGTDVRVDVSLGLYLVDSTSWSQVVIELRHNGVLIVRRIPSIADAQLYASVDFSHTFTNLNAGTHYWYINAREATNSTGVQADTGNNNQVSVTKL